MYGKKTGIICLILCIIYLSIGINAEARITYDDGPLPTKIDGAPEVDLDRAAYLSNNYKGFFNSTEFGDLNSITSYLLRGAMDNSLYGLELNYNYDMPMMFYGSFEYVKSATGLDNPVDAATGRAKYFGIAVDGLSGISNFRYPDSVKTTGNPGARSIIPNPWSLSSDAQSNAYHPVNPIFNKPANLSEFVKEKGGNLTIEQADAAINIWMEQIVDKYSLKLNEFWKPFVAQENNTNWSRSYSDTSNHLTKIPLEQRKKKIYIAQPPTGISYGVAVEWHNTSSGPLYDSFWIGPVELEFENIKVARGTGALVYFGSEVAAGTVPVDYASNHCWKVLKMLLFFTHSSVTTGAPRFHRVPQNKAPLISWIGCRKNKQ